jgi:hypothetical protein
MVLLLALAPFFLLQCASPEPPAGKTTSGKQVLAKAGDTEITEEDIQERIRGQLLRINNQIYTIKKRALDTVVAELLLEEEARKRNLTRGQLLEQEVPAKVAQVSDAEVEQYYKANQKRLKKPLEELKPRLVQQLTNAKQRERSAAFYQELRKAAQVQVFLQPPIIHVATDSAPARGPANAPVTIVEFSDFQ